MIVQLVPFLVLLANAKVILVQEDRPPLSNRNASLVWPMIKGPHRSSGLRWVGVKIPEEVGLEVPVEPPLLFGAFNIQTLGRKKFNDPDIMKIVEKVILRYDLMLVMEIMTDDRRHLEKLLRNVNSFAPDGAVYNMTLGENHNVTLEQCAYFYRTNKLMVLKSESFDHPTNRFYRKPLVAVFHSPTLRDLTKFVAIGHHVKPSQAVQELNELAELYDFVQMKYAIEDVLLMGDFNADCNYVKEQDWEQIELWTRREFTWIIGNHVDTTTNYRSCALDRFVYAGENLNDGVILNSGKIFNFQEEFALTTDMTRKVSDHWPIEFKIRGRLSPAAEKYLSSEVCFKIRDSRSTNVSEEDVYKAAAAACFTATVTRDGLKLSNVTSKLGDLKNAFEGIRNVLPGSVTREQYHGALYKLEHGSLADDSSYSDVGYQVFEIEILLNSVLSTVTLCKTTSIN